MNKKQLTLGQLINKLEKCTFEWKYSDEKTERQKGIFFDFCNFKPSDVGSWRGSYDELFIGYSEDKTTFKSAKEFLETLKYSEGSEFTGYKGGEFLMTRETPVWVADYRVDHMTGVVDILEFEHFIIIETAYIDYETRDEL